MMMRLVKLVLLLALLGLGAVVGYSYFGDLSAPERESIRKIEIDVD